MCPGIQKLKMKREPNEDFVIVCYKNTSNAGEKFVKNAPIGLILALY